MNTNKEVFLANAKLYFNDDYDKFISLLNEKPKSAFFINEKKGTRKDILDLVDFKYKQSELYDKSFYHNCDSIGKTKAYELGLIYPQDVESSLPVSYIKDIKDIKYAIDLCAAPGGKSINLLNRLDEDSLLICNEVSYKRAGALVSNLERLGLSNVMVTSLKTKQLANKYPGLFDLVILDAPCSGEGIIRKYPEILDEYNQDNIDHLASVQKDLLEDAYKLLKKDGQLLYSTCTYSFKEDEKQISDFLNLHNDVELILLDDIANNSSTLKGTIKLSPLNNTEGQFICLMKKNGGDVFAKPKFKKGIKNKIIEEFIKTNLNIDDYYLYADDNRYYLSFIPLLDIEHNVLTEGIYLGEIIKNRFEPSFSLYRSNLLMGKFKNIYTLNDEQYKDYIQGLELKSDINDGYYLIEYKGYSLGFGKASKGILKNKYPKGLRRVV